MAALTQRHPKAAEYSKMCISWPTFPLVHHFTFSCCTTIDSPTMDSIMASILSLALTQLLSSASTTFSNMKFISSLFLFLAMFLFLICLSKIVLLQPWICYITTLPPLTIYQYYTLNLVFLLYQLQTFWTPTYVFWSYHHLFSTNKPYNSSSHSKLSQHAINHSGLIKEIIIYEGRCLKLVEYISLDGKYVFLLSFFFCYFIHFHR